MNKKILLAIITALIAFTSCDDNTDTIGTSLTDNIDNLNIIADTFDVTTTSIVVDSVLSRSNMGYIGKIKDPETGTYTSSDFMVQFHVLENYSFPDIEKIRSLKDGKVVADSCELRLYYTGYYGDSLATMKLTAYDMSKPMKENVGYYTSFDPMKEGYVRTDGIKENLSYTLLDLTKSSEERSDDDFVSNIKIPLNSEYKDSEGNTYDNYGTYILRKYYSNPSDFNNSYKFIHNVCPGFFLKSSYGVGNMAYVYMTQLNVYYRYENKDSVYNKAAVFSGTEEVLQTNHIVNDKEAIKRLASDNSCTYLKTPSGIFTEMTLPVEDIMKGHRNDTLNTAKITLQRINNTVSDKYSLDIPQTLLMIPRDSIYSFFKNGNIPNNKISYIATYSSNENAYTFNNISNLITTVNKAKEAGGADFIAKHPNWNKVVIIPVNVTDYSGTINKVFHNMSLTSTKLVGGPNSKIKISVIYSKFD